MLINSNINTSGIYRQSSSLARELSQSYEQLSSGLRINRSSDDPAGLAVSTQLSAQASLFRQGMRNVSDTTSLLNVAEAALDAMTTIVTRQRELAQRAASGSATAGQRLTLGQEAGALQVEYNRIVQSTSFNGLNLLNGMLPELRVQAGSSGYTVEGVEIEVPGITTVVGSGTFQTATTLATGGSPRSVTSADVNGDGKIDLVSAESGSNRLRVFLGNGNGTFLAPTTLATGSAPESVIAADVNGDGKLDLVSVDNGSDRLSIFFGNGNGTFQAVTTVATGFSPRAIAAADVNGDGKLDFVSADSGNSRLSVFLGNGNGTFLAPTTLATGSTPVGVSAADVNGDGKLDLVSVDSSSNRLSIFFGNGNGSFQAATTLATGIFPDGVIAADLNGDGKLDLVSADSSPSHLRVFLGNGNGTFQAATTFATGLNPISVAAADVNGDGKLDLVSADYGSDRLSLLLGNGNGTFQAATGVATGSGTRSASVVDLNGDGIADLVSADGSSNRLSVFIQNATTTTSASGIYEVPLDFTTTAAALSTGNYLSRVADALATARAGVGANLSRLEVTFSNLTSMTDLHETAASRILDVDVAEELARTLRLQVVLQGNAAINAQANVQAKSVLQLLDNSFGRRSA